MTVRVEAPARLHLGMLAAAGDGARRFGGQLLGPLGLEHDRGTADRDAEAAETARAVARGRQHAQMQARRRLDTHRHEACPKTLST